MRLVSGIIETIVMSHGDEVGVGDNGVNNVVC